MYSRGPPSSLISTSTTSKTQYHVNCAMNETVKKANKRLHYLRDYRKAQLPPDVGTTVYCTKISMGWAPRLPRKWNLASSAQKSRYHRCPQGHASSTWTKERRSSKSGTAARFTKVRVKPLRVKPLRVKPRETPTSGTTTPIFNLGKKA